MHCIILTAIAVSGFLPLSLSSAFSENELVTLLLAGRKLTGSRRANHEKLKRHAVLRDAEPFTFYTAGSRERVAEIRERAAGKSGRNFVLSYSGIIAASLATET